MAVFRIWEREGSLLLLIKGMLTEEVRMTGKKKYEALINAQVLTRFPSRLASPAIQDQLCHH